MSQFAASSLETAHGLSSAGDKLLPLLPFDQQIPSDLVQYIICFVEGDPKTLGYFQQTCKRYRSQSSGSMYIMFLEYAKLRYCRQRTTSRNRNPPPSMLIRMCEENAIHHFRFLLFGSESNMRAPKEIKAELDQHGRDREGMRATPLGVSVHLGSLAFVRLIVSLRRPSIDINEKDIYNEKTALMTAAEKGHADILAFLLRLPEIDVNIYNFNGRGALYYAARAGNLPCIRLLIDAGSERLGEALTVACSFGHVNVVEQFLSMCTEKLNINDGSSLHGACSRGNVLIAKKLLDVDGINVNKTDESGQTPLWLAASEGHHEIVQLLLRRKGVKINETCDTSGRTALHWAAINNHPKVVKLLVNHMNTTILKKDNDGETALDHAVTWSNHKCARLIKTKLKEKSIDFVEDVNTLWEKVYDECSCRYYYQKKDTFEIAWEKPEGFLENDDERLAHQMRRQTRIEEEGAGAGYVDENLVSNQSSTSRSSFSRPLGGGRRFGNSKNPN